MPVIDEIIGNVKRYQRWVCALVFISKFGIGFHQMAVIFLAPPVVYKCPNVKQMCCADPIYDKSIYTNTMVMQWNLICDKAWLSDFSQMLFQLGVLIGSVVFGMLSDRFGRRPILIIAVVLELFTGVLSCIMPDYWSFTIVRAILGAAVGGVMVVGFVIVMEYVGTTYRDVISALYQLPFTLGHMLLPLFGYFLRDFIYFQLAISLVNLVLLSYICFLPETPRWLLAKNRTNEAIDLMTKIAKCNNMPHDTVHIKVTSYQMMNHHESTGTVIDLFRTPNLRKNTIVMCFLWLSACLCYYGEAQYISHFSGDVYINVMASAGVSSIGVLFSIPLMKLTKRRTSIIILSICCGLSFILVSVIPNGKASVVFGCAGVMFGFMMFIILYLYCTELFPTVVRNGALGLASMTGRLGAMVAPFVVSLKTYGDWCAPILFGLFPLISVIGCCLLPETKMCELMMTLAEGEAFGTRDPNVNETDVNRTDVNGTDVT